MALRAAYGEAVADIHRSRTVAADPNEVWDVLADFGSISSWADNIDHSCILNHGSEPVGTTRDTDQYGRNRAWPNAKACRTHGVSRAGATVRRDARRTRQPMGEARCLIAPTSSS